MAPTLFVRWTAVPRRAPEILRRCGRCAAERAFASSGKIRLNANGRRLDGWLIYRCRVCDRTWNRPVIDRAPVSEIDPEELVAMQVSAPERVREIEADHASLRRHGEPVATTAVDVLKPSAPDGAEGWTTLRLDIVATLPTGLRLDRLLAAEFGVARGRVRTWARAGAVATAGARLSKPLVGDVEMTFDAAGLSEIERDAVTRGAFA